MTNENKPTSKILKIIRKWFVCQFSIVISEKEARELNLKFDCNVYGDQINYWNCRSLWRDSKRNIYRIRELMEANTNAK